MEYKKEGCFMINPNTGAIRLIEQAGGPEEIVKGFLKWSKEPESLLWAMDQLVYEDWQKWEPVRKELWAMLEELDKLGY